LNHLGQTILDAAPALSFASGAHRELPAMRTVTSVDPFPAKLPGPQSIMETKMDKKIAGLLGAAAALASLNSAQAAAPPDPTEVLKARSYSDLLGPIPNAMAVLEAVDRAASDSEANVQVAQFYVGRSMNELRQGDRPAANR
jgi:hypothetical protein